MGLGRLFSAVGVQCGQQAPSEADTVLPVAETVRAAPGSEHPHMQPGCTKTITANRPYVSRRTGPFPFAARLPSMA